MRMVTPTPASASLHQVSTDYIVVVYSSLVCNIMGTSIRVGVYFIRLHVHLCVCGEEGVRTSVGVSVGVL